MECGETFEIKVNLTKKFCCRDCYFTYAKREGLCKHSEETKKKIGNRHRRERLEKVCLFCGEKFYVPKCLLVLKYCSMKCFGLDHRREKSAAWQGGVQRLPYSFDFDSELKELIRKRDDYKCRKCGKSQRDHIQQVGEKLNIHHIDYDKGNSDPDNLITLCRSCHAKTQFNRTHWREFFGEKLYSAI